MDETRLPCKHAGASAGMLVGGYQSGQPLTCRRATPGTLIKVSTAMN